uniref:Uncharacterized protein n=1 Tax=Cladobotryum mycophilum TaxID=491253 RepID=A0A7S8FIQ4_9HYPO|nr:hypothetical protein J6781_mgp07 [Cladobotryum mycophilum]QPD06675.1 hypothetical protein [Cladobotryum mycophilum]
MHCVISLLIIAVIIINKWNSWSFNTLLINNILFYKNILINLLLNSFKFNLIKLVLTIIRNIFNKYIIIYMFNDNISSYLIFFMVNLKRSETNFFTKKIAFALDLLIEKIYDDVKNINSWIFFIIGCYIYFFLGDYNIICTYLYKFSFLIGTLIKIIIINKKFLEYYEFKHNFPLIYNIIKCFLLGLLFFNLCLLVVIGQKIWIFIINYLKNFVLKINILDKIKDLKLSLDYKRFKGPQNPKDPQNSKISFFFNKKKSKENKKTAFELKEKILKVQSNLNDNNLDVKPIQTSFNKKRNWNETIDIKEVPTFSVSDQLKNAQYEFKAYDNQDKKFKTIVINIGKGKENFYPDESRTLFNEYISVIKILKDNLKSFAA